MMQIGSFVVFMDNFRQKLQYTWCPLGANNYGFYISFFFKEHITVVYCGHTL